MKQSIFSFFLFLMAASQSTAQGAELTSTVQRTNCPNNQITFDGACRGEAFFEDLTAKDFRFISASGCNQITLGTESDICGASVILTEQNTETGRTRTLTLDQRPREKILENQRRRDQALQVIASGRERGGYAVLRVISSEGLSLPGGDYDVEMEVKQLGETGLLATVLTQDLRLSKAPSDAAARQDYDVTGRICARRLDVQVRPEKLACTCLDDGLCGRGTEEQDVIFSSGPGETRYCARSSRYDESRDGIVVSELDLKLSAGFPRKNIPELQSRLASSPGEDGLTCFSVRGMHDGGVTQAYSQAAGSASCQVNIVQDGSLSNLACVMGQGSLSFTAGAAAFVAAPVWYTGTSGTGVSYAGQDISIGHVASTSWNAFTSTYSATTDAIQTAVNMTNADTCNDPGLMINSFSMDAQMCNAASSQSCEGTHTIKTRVELPTGAQCDAVVDLDCTAATSASAVSLTDIGCICTQTDARLDYSTCR